MTTEPFTLIEFTNTTSSNVEVHVTDPSGSTHVVAWLNPGESTRQVSPSGAWWAMVAVDGGDEPMPVRSGGRQIGL
jgi:hypothetical protein